MTARSAKVLRGVVYVLRDADGTPIHEAVIQHELSMFVGNPTATKAEVEEALRQAELRGWAAATVSEMDSKLWAITSKGRLAELK